MLEKAIKLAVIAHEGQRDKGGNPYILHPLRVMMSLETEEEKIIGVLHDVIEDTWVTKTFLSEMGFSIRIVTAIELLTRNIDETYSEFIERCATNELAKKVKLADIADNKDLSRIKEPTDQDFNRLKRYLAAEEVLISR